MRSDSAQFWSNPILHADLDAFYASVETLLNPSLKGAAVIVGGTSSRGVVTSASYEARAYGVHSAMPIGRARRLCPHGIFIQPNFGAYITKSNEVRELFGTFSVAVEPLSLDEAFLDLSRAIRMWPNPPTVAEELRERILSETGLVVSVGVAPNKFLAKLASKHAKPDGIVVVDSPGVQEFLRPLPVGDLWGVGLETQAILNRLGLYTIGDVAAVPKASLERVLGSFGAQIADLAVGRDERPVVPGAPPKSLGAEETFEYDLVEPAQILGALLKLSDRVAARLRGQGISGKTTTLKVRLDNFSTFTRSRTLKYEIDGATSIYAVARELLGVFVGGEELGGKRIRLLGISISNLSQWPAGQQITFGKCAEWAAAERALDEVRRRFGEDSVGFGALLQSP
jgi:DNA polymerase IV